ncbi:unnamed protein product [Knipowitschia caucasica]|uniref:ADP-ribosylation factor-like 13A n=2 Tax=Knipowitschia caucasica TaxID=637954 RepID=A0AAV2MKU5_KNICA
MAVDLLLYQFRKRWWPQCSPQINMFNLISNCCTWVSKIQEPIRKLTILVVGLDKAGKTSSIKGMLREAHGGEAGPTQGCVRHELRVENYLVTLLDTGGAAECRCKWKELYGEAHGVIFVVDSCDRQRMNEVKEVLGELLKHPRVAGKPLLVLANKQDKMNSFLGSELIEILSLEKLVNQSRSLCHIEPCSALMDLRRWSDRKTLRGLRWLLRAVCLDYPDLCARVIHDSKQPLESQQKDKTGKKKSKSDRMESSKSSLRQVHRPKEREKKTTSEGKLQPIRNMLQKETSLKKKLTKKKKKKQLPKGRENEKDEEIVNDEEEEETTEIRVKANSVLIPSQNKPKAKTKSREPLVDASETPTHGNNKTHRVKAENKKKKKGVKVKKKNKINTESLDPSYTQPVDLSSTFDLYRKAIMALKERQEQVQG